MARDARCLTVTAGTVVLASGPDANLVDSLADLVLGRPAALTAGAGVAAGDRPQVARGSGAAGAVPCGADAVPDVVVEAVR